MSRLYGEQHRRFQDRFDTRRIADRLEQVACRTALDDGDKAFIGAADMFFLSTIDDRGRPTVSYKGGNPGFVRVLNDSAVAFPSYDGNGMFLSMGNISIHPEIGMLFISFERPHRLRLQGCATISQDAQMLAEYPGADLLVIVTLTDVFPNCPRYVHRYQKLSASRYVPQCGQEAPLAEWKRIDFIQDALPHRDVARAQAAGVISADDWMERVKRGDPSA
jgi:predicted pyridoxine 5'-phosphate oxidase superfamily flavin-nucleotide-binding protein